MDKKKSEPDKNSLSNLPAKVPEKDISEHTKHTFRQRLARLLMVTETKDKSLIGELSTIKDAMHENFCKEGTWKAEYINRIFRLYANKDKDIKISKPQFKLFSKYIVNVPGISQPQQAQQKNPKTKIDTTKVSQEETIRITQYLKTLRFIRAGLNPMVHDIKSFGKQANDSASKIEKQQPVEYAFSAFDNSISAGTHNVIAKENFKLLIDQSQYNRDRFAAEQSVISSSLESNNYHDLMIFALMGFHYFDKKSEVYESFSDEQKKKTMISFKLHHFRPTTISLGAFLKIIENLDFKRHVFLI